MKGASPQPGKTNPPGAHDLSLAPISDVFSLSHVCEYNQSGHDETQERRSCSTGLEGEKMSSLATAHIQLDNAGVAWIDDSNVKVIEVAMDKIAHGWNPEEIHFQHPHLSLAQIHAALSYYYDHQHDIDREIEKELQDVESMARQVSQSPLRRRLRAIGQLP